MLDFNSVKNIYPSFNFDKKVRAPAAAPERISAQQRQSRLLKLTSDMFMGSSEISRSLGENQRTIKSDIKSLVERGLLINASKNIKSYLVRAA